MSCNPGEPGIGKTVTLKKGYNSLERDISRQGDRLFWIDLRAYGSEVRLSQDLFQSSVFTEWLSGDHDLHIFLDSLDECLLQLKHVSAFLLDQLQKIPIDRLKIRIICRTSEWPKVLEEGFRKTWGSSNVGIFEITPLRKKDVIEAVNANGLDSDAFLLEVIEKNAVPFTINPITLNFFINIFRNDESLPVDLVDLYLEGCRCLCTEHNENLRYIRRTETLDANIKLIIASRIAALTLLSNREGISYSPLQATISEEDVHIDQMIGGYEFQDTNRITVDSFSIYETFNTSLFTSHEVPNA